MSTHVSLSNNTEFCMIAKTLHEDLLLISSQIGQIILASANLVLLGVAIWTYKRNKLVLHYNFMLLMANIIILYAFNNIGILATNLRYQILLFFKFEPCDFLTPMWLNILLRLYSYFYTTAFVLFHFALTTERARATIFARRYEREGNRYALSCIIIIWTITVAFNGYMILLAMGDAIFHNPSLHVSITTTSNSTWLLVSHMCAMVIVIITAIIDYLLLYANRKNKSKVEDYSLSRSYQINENIIVMKLIWPLDVCFTIVFTLYFIGSCYLRFAKEKLTLTQFVANYEVIYMLLPMHSLVTLLLYLYFVKKNKSKLDTVIQTGDHTQIHFEQLESQWIVTQRR